MAATAAVLAGYAADRALGAPSRLHPVAGFGAVAAALEAHLWRASRVAGAAYAAVLVGGTWAAAAALRRVLPPHPGATLFFDAAILWTALGGRSLERAANALVGAVEAGDLERARALAPALVGRDPSELGPEELCRAAVESVAENPADAVLAPASLVRARRRARCGRVPGREHARRDGRTPQPALPPLRLGRSPAGRSAQLAGRARGPALVTALAPSVGGSSRRTWRTVRRDGGSHPSPNAGRMEAAFAGALDLRLGGVNHYGDRVERRPSLGSGAAPAPADVRRAIRLARAVSHVGTLLAAAAGVRR